MKQLQVKVKRQARKADDTPEPPAAVRPDIARRWFPQEGDR